MPDDLVSVIVPTYNRRVLLQKAIESVQAQTWHRWELIVVDDGSSDGTGDDIPADGRIRMIRRPRTGNVAAVRNAGLSEANGSLIGFLDSDDRWQPEKLALQIARLGDHPDCGWCYGRFQLIDLEGHAIPERSGFAWQPREGRFLKEMITTEAAVSLQTVIVRRDLAMLLRFDETIPWGDDYDFLVRLAMASPACAVDRHVADVREHADRGNHHRYDQMLNFAVAYRRYEKILDAPELKALCRRRAHESLRHYLANARAHGALATGLSNATIAWWREWGRSR